MKNGLIVYLHWTSIVRVFHQMSDETGNSDSERFGVDDRNFFDDPLVGFKVITAPLPLQNFQQFTKISHCAVKNSLNSIFDIVHLALVFDFRFLYVVSSSS